jgi:hypothetical protein
VEEDLVELEVPRGPTTKLLPFADDVETSPWPSASEPKPTMISPASFVTQIRRASGVCEGVGIAGGELG